MHDEDEQEELEFAELGPSIPRFEFKNRRGQSGWATFNDLDDLTGSQMRKIRKAAGSSDNNGEAANAFFNEVLGDLVEAWGVPGKPNLTIPRYDKKALDSCPATFLAALEKHVKPHLDFMSNAKDGKDDDGEPGGPSRPGSE